jgi:hypothetical protein
MKYVLTVALIALGILAPAPLAWADSYGPFLNFRKVDATGRFYVVVKKAEGAPEDPGAGTPVNFEFAERAPGSPPVHEAYDEYDVNDSDRVVPNPEVKVREGDIVHGRAKLDRSPRRILISSTGLGFVGIDVGGYNYGLLRSGDAVVIVGKDGTVRHRKDLIDLFTEEEVGRFLRTAGGVWWAGGGWIDERLREVVIVSSDAGPQDNRIPRLFRIVNMETGDVRPGSAREIITALAERNRGALDQALELTAELKLNDAREHLPPIFADEQLPTLTRMRAAVALAGFGDRRGAALMEQTALANTDNRYYAVQNLPVVLGDEAASVLCDVVRRFGMDGYTGAWQAMDSVSSAVAVPELIRLLEENRSLACQSFAAECLGSKGPAATAAVPSLIRVLEGAPRTEGWLSNHEHAAIALGKIGPEAKEALPALTRLARQHAPEELDRVKNNRPAIRDDPFGDWQYSEDYFVEAICKIRNTEDRK